MLYNMVGKGQWTRLDLMNERHHQVSAILSCGSHGQDSGELGTRYG